MLFVREATKEDIANIAELEKVSFAIPWSEESIRHDVLESSIANVLVAELDDKFAGYADVWIVSGEGQMNNIAVVPELRGIGIGTSLMAEVVDLVRNQDCTEMSLEVRPSNERAMNMYKSLGFREVGERGGYYLDDGEAAAIMKIYFD